MIELEKQCPLCKGAGGEDPDDGSGWSDCIQCGGSGYVTTAMGDRIVALMQHNLKPILKKVGAEIFAGR